MLYIYIWIFIFICMYKCISINIYIYIYVYIIHIWWGYATICKGSMYVKQLYVQSLGNGRYDSFARQKIAEEGNCQQTTTQCWMIIQFQISVNSFIKHNEMIWINRSVWPKYQCTFGEDTEQAPAAVYPQRRLNPAHENMIGDDLCHRPIWQQPATRIQTALRSPPPLKINWPKENAWAEGARDCSSGGPTLGPSRASPIPHRHHEELLSARDRNYQKLFKQISKNNWSRSI